MSNEIRVLIDNEINSVYLDDGFCVENAEFSPFHKHYHTEIQLLLKGTQSCNVNNNQYNLQRGFAFLIPANVYHSTNNPEPNTKRVSFFIDKNIREENLKKLPLELIDLFAKEIEAFKETNNLTRLQGYITTLCCILFDDNSSSKDNINYGFLIESFFMQNFNKNFDLADLAKYLNVSKKHASRLVMKHTGNNFTDELTKRRMEVAEILLTDQGLSKAKVGEYVGYNTYSGFYKAYEKYASNKQNTKT